jgi:hypothetical protein
LAALPPYNQLAAAAFCPSSRSLSLLLGSHMTDGNVKSSSSLLVLASVVELDMLL